MNKATDKKAKQGPNHQVWIIALLALVALLFLSRGLVWLIPTVIFPAFVITMIFWLWNKWSNKSEKSKPSIITEIQAKIQDCDEQVMAQEKDLEEIEDTVLELQKQLNGAYELNQKSWAETQQLLKAFEEEKKIRFQKIDFFKNLKQNLSTLLYNQEAVERIKAKKERLTELRADHYDDLAKMESLKQGLAYDQEFLATVQRLSLEMIKSKHLNKVETIRKEFDKIIEEMS